MVHSFLDNYNLLKLAFANGLFSKHKDLRFFSDQEKLYLIDIEKVLLLFKHFVVFLEYEVILTSPYFCDLVDAFYNRISSMTYDTRHPDFERALGTLLKSINDRFKSYYLVTNPITWCRFLYPSTAAFAGELSIDLLKDLGKSIAEWAFFHDKLKYPDDDTAAAVASEYDLYASKFFKSSNSDRIAIPSSILSNNNSNTNENDVPEKYVHMVARYLFDMKKYVSEQPPPHPPSVVAFPPSDLTVEQRKTFSTKACATALMEYSTKAMETLTSNCPDMKALLRIMLCASSSSAEVERCFSGGALTDTAKRNRLSPAKFEMICIVRQFLMKCEKINMMDTFLAAVDAKIGALRQDDVPMEHEEVIDV